jgi:CubicO group peptidase (beta-lactamase class C family)
MKIKKILFFLITPLSVLSQNLPDSTYQKIDKIFSAFNSKTPGCAVAIIKDGTVLFQKGYGQANLEYPVPIVPATVFHIASESKQYVAFCILLLEKEGKLSIDEDIRKYLDYVPDFGHKITIRHLIYHTSGLRDQWQLLANAGWQLDDVITQEHVIKLVSKQKALNFIPGEEMMYCNTGYTLMAEIVKKVSGLSLREYADKNIFQPLGMNDTHFHDNYQEIVPGRAYSYTIRPGKGYEHSVLSYSIVGATSLLTTVLDECKWLNNFETGTVGGKVLVEKMHEVGALNDGRKLIYAFALSIEGYKGWRQIGHGGGDAGFRTYACRFPEKRLGIVVFSNSGTVNPVNFVHKIADVLITEIKEEPKPEDKKAFTDTSIHKKLPGRYYSERGDAFEIIWRNGQLIARNPAGATLQMNLAVAGNNRYSVNGGKVLVLDEKNKLSDSIQNLTMENYANTTEFKRQPAVTQKITAEFTGKYYNGETEAFYYVTEKDGQLTLAHRKYPDVALKTFAPDQFTSPHWWMRHIRFIRDKKRKITGFEVNSDRVYHLMYDKVN